MLFGSKEHQNLVLEKAESYAKELDGMLLFGAVQGSISKGMQRADSDYDARFLYLRKDFPQKICVPFQMGEDELVHRNWLNNPTLQRIPLWEATSFLQLLLEPRFTDEISDGLYVTVEWTLHSPYVWDPYGIQGKLMPLVSKIFRKEYVISYYNKVLEKYRVAVHQEMVVSKIYLRAVYAKAAIEWCIRYSEFPPLNMDALLLGLGRTAVWEESKKILYQARIDTRQVWESSLTKQELVKYISPTILTPRNTILIDYIDGTHCQTRLEGNEIKKANLIDDAEIVSNMYKIIYSSVFENGETLNYGWNCE